MGLMLLVVIDSIRLDVCLEITNRQIGQCRVYIELVSTSLPVSCVITPFLHCIIRLTHTNV